jgi:adenosine deaminase
MTLASVDHVRALPKVELHCHVEGSTRASTISALARKNGVRLPVDDPNELFSFTDLNHFLSIYEIICRSMVTADDFHRIAYEALQDGAAAGVRYREMFFSAGIFLNLGVPVETVWTGLVAGVEDAEVDAGIRCRLILDVDKPSPPAQAMELVQFAATQDRDRLVGIGGDSTERGTDHRAFAPAFAEAARVGLHRTFHAGEDGPPDNIRASIEDLGCERIDHGLRLLEDPELTAMVIDRQIPLTVCPTSNVVIANAVPDVASHPIARQRQLGVLVTVNSDDPGMMRFNVADEYAAVHQAFDWDLETMEDLALAGITACWAPPEEKVELRAQFIEAFEELRSTNHLPPYGPTTQV